MFKTGIKFLKTIKSSIILYLSIVLIGWSIGFINPLINAKILDTLTISKDINYFYFLTILAAIAGLSSVIINYISLILSSKIITKFINFNSTNAVNNLMSAKIVQYEGMNVGYLSQRIYSDSNNISSFILSAMKDIPVNILTLVFSGVILAFVSIEIFTFLMCLIPFYIILYKIFSEKLYKYSKIYKESENVYFEGLNSQLELMKFIKTNALSKYFQSNFLNVYNNLFKDMIKTIKVSGKFSNLGLIVTVIANIVITIVGGIKIIDGAMTIGDYNIISTYFNAIIKTIDYFLNYSKTYQSAKVSYDRLDELSKFESEKFGNNKLDDIKEIEVKDLKFSFDGTSNIINDFSYKFERGNVYRILGHNGKGKSTFFSTIVGLYEGNYTGDIIYNSKSISDLDMNSLRYNNISYVGQNLSIINGTIIENIVMDRHIDLELVNELVDHLNLSKTLNSKPLGINTEVSRNSYNLSGGEKQKINIIRSLLKTSDVLLLDEVNSALDKDTTIKLIDIIKKIKNEKIILIISHSDDFNEVVDYNVDFDSSSCTKSYN